MHASSQEQQAVEFLALLAKTTTRFPLNPQQFDIASYYAERLIEIAGELDRLTGELQAAGIATGPSYFSLLPHQEAATKALHAMAACLIARQVLTDAARHAQ